MAGYQKGKLPIALNIAFNLIYILTRGEKGRNIYDFDE